MNTTKSYALAAILAGAFLTSCNQNKNDRDNNISETVRTDTIHTSENSVDYKGTYVGTLPCADCEGIRTEIDLQDDDTYKMTTTYQGKGNENDNTYTEEGSYTWNSAGNVITLNNEHNQKYQVGEDKLYSLDLDGNRITGDMADLYILHKK